MGRVGWQAMHQPHHTGCIPVIQAFRRTYELDTRESAEKPDIKVL